MNKLEIACVIIGFMCMIINISNGFEGTTKGLLITNIFNVIRNLIYLAMILVPMYFRFWR